MTSPRLSLPLLFTETTIIFDWDDTLLSSSWLAQNGLRLDEPQVVVRSRIGEVISTGEERLWGGATSREEVMRFAFCVWSTCSTRSAAVPRPCPLPSPLERRSSLVLHVFLACPRSAPHASHHASMIVPPLPL